MLQRDGDQRRFGAASVTASLWSVFDRNKVNALKGLLTDKLIHDNSLTGAALPL
jgi:hypothetical protein